MGVVVSDQRLTRRSCNALMHVLNKPFGFDPLSLTPSDIKHLTINDLRNCPNLGKRGMAEVMAWAAEGGVELKGGVRVVLSNSPAAERLIKAAISLLEAEGYKVERKV